ncbi:MAG: cytochrome c oxidase subunit 4 [Frankia sp.]|nr:cytochrome c oxidase subunit 4 [Frankia sp.]
MKGTALLFLGLAGFFLVTGTIYLITSRDPTGSAVLVFSLLMCLLVAFYLAVTARRTHLAADDRDRDISDGTGEIGFFSPVSYWPPALAVSSGILLIGPAIGLWLVLIGAGLVAACVIGLVFQHLEK